MRAGRAGRSFGNRHPGKNRRVAPSGGEADRIHQVAGLGGRRLLALDNQSAGSILNENRVAWVAPGDDTLHPHAPAGDLGWSELHQAVNRKDGESVGVGGRWPIHTDLIHARGENLDTDELPSIVKQRRTRANGNRPESAK